MGSFRYFYNRLSDVLLAWAVGVERMEKQEVGIRWFHLRSES
jgi:hypothetical protein